MNDLALQNSFAQSRDVPILDAVREQDPSDTLSVDCRGLNFYDIDPGLQQLLELRLPKDVFNFVQPHLKRLGELAGSRLDELASTANHHIPVLHTRDRFGRNEDWVEYHPAYREMERIGYTEFGIHAMSRTEGVLGWPKRFLPLAKYAFQYLFVQSEFGLMCPIAVTDSSVYVIEKYGDAALKQRFLPGMVRQDAERMLKGTQFMTEKPGGSDVGTNQLRAVCHGDTWRLHGEKWFCSAVDADVVLVLARPDGAPAGTKGLALYALPRRLEDGTRNTYRIVKLKNKLGTRSMPTGEVIFDGALAYLVGDQARGLKQMLDQVNLSRLSHGVRAAAMMRRCLNEAFVAAKSRVAFKKDLIDHALLRRQLLKIMLPTEQALSMFVYTADTMRRAESGEGDAALELRALTPLLKFRTCRDNIKVATGALEIRGGNGFIEDFVNARLVRDAHTGVLWEGTSSIVALDLVQRAAGKKGGHLLLQKTLIGMLDSVSDIPSAFVDRLKGYLVKSTALLGECASQAANESRCRQVASLFYHCSSACLLACEGAAIGRAGGDARRLLLAKLVLDHRVDVRDPFDIRIRENEAELESLLLSDDPIPLEKVATLV
jgi:alkylation response protein AidB-like acyl-CoA dehydrogenase